MKKQITTPFVNLIRFQSADIITTSDMGGIRATSPNINYGGTTSAANILSADSKSRGFSFD